MDFEIPLDLRMVQETVRKFIETEMIPLENTFPEGPEFPPEIRKNLEKKAKEIGLWALDIPVEYGGEGFGQLAMAYVLEEFSQTLLLPFRSPLIVCAPNLQILYQANSEQKEKFLLPVIRGEKRVAFGMSEPQTGSDQGSMLTRAVRKGDRWVINGQKMWISGGDEADFLQLFAVTDPGRLPEGGITCFVVEKGTPGFQVIGKIELMVPDRPCILGFENCEVPDANRVGEVGEGWELIQKWLTVGRLRQSTRALGMATRALVMATEYAKSRVTFGKPLIERQAVQQYLAESAIELHASRLMTYHAAWRMDEGHDIRPEVAMLNYYVNEAAFRIVDRTMQIYGGIGMSKDLPIERMWRDLRSIRITEWPSEVQLNIVADNVIAGLYPGVHQFS